MKNKFWNELYGLDATHPKQKYRSKKECLNLANKIGADIKFDWYGRRKHQLTFKGEVLDMCEGYDELYDELLLC